jgi:hypothetical protein
VTTPLAFWNEAHARRDEPKLGGSTVEQILGVFGKIGPFVDDLEKADAVLDVGPGFASLLAALKDKLRFAIDISPVARKQLEVMGVSSCSTARTTPWRGSSTRFTRRFDPAGSSTSSGSTAAPATTLRSG